MSVAICPGGVSDACEFTDQQRKALDAYVRPDPKRADELEDALARGDGVLLPRHVWPDMPVMTCWKGGTVGSFTSQFDDYFPHDLPVRDIGYLATELRGSVPITSEAARKTFLIMIAPRSWLAKRARGGGSALRRRGFDQ